MNIVHVISKFAERQWGGAEEVVLNLACRQAADNHSVEIFTTDAFQGAGEVRGCTSAGVRVRRFPRLSLTRDRKLRQQWDARGIHMLSPWMLAAVLRYRAAQAVFHLHLHNSLTAAAAFPCLLKGIPYVYHLHSHYDHHAKNRDASFLRIPRFFFSHHDALSRSDAIICLTQAQADELRRFFPEKRIAVIPNGVAPDQFGSVDPLRFRKQHGLEGRPLLLNVGKIYPLKNQLFLLELLGPLRDSFPDCALVLIGHIEDAAYYRQLQETIDRKRLRDHVLIIPGVPPRSAELLNAYAACDCFVLPSLEEAFPVVVLEAWAAGCPVIASRTVGTASQLTPGVNGMLLAEWDVREWCIAVEQVLRDRGFRHTLVRAAREELLLRYSWNSIASRVLRLYRDISPSPELPPVAKSSSAFF